jgi:GNAT superfamily N-acetyltransferase
VSAQIREQPIEELARHGDVRMAYTVDRVLELSAVDDGLGGFSFTESVVAVPWVNEIDDAPKSWATEFDVSRWGLLGAYDGTRRIGGAVIAFDTDGVRMLEGRRDLAVLWDLRVEAAARSRGIGTQLFRASESWARPRGCRQLKIETQNVNVPACRFYRRMGCTLGVIDRFAYPDFPEQIAMLWYKDL